MSRFLLLALSLTLLPAADLKVGIIGLDTSHVTAFTGILNVPSNANHVPGGKVVAAYRGGSPDMGNVSADGRQLWLSGRFDNVVYAIDTTTGEMKSIPVGKEPHGLTVWPQPGRYSLGHTGNLR